MKTGILAFTVILTLTACNKSAYENLERFSYYHSDGSKTLYLADSISPPNYTLVENVPTGHLFLVPNLQKSNRKIRLSSLLKSSDCYLVDNQLRLHYKYIDWDSKERMMYDRLQGKCSSYRENPSFKGKDKDFKFVEFERPPLYYRVAFVRGDAYNYICCGYIIDGPYKPLPFPDLKLYYPILLPVWKE